MNSLKQAGVFAVAESAQTMPKESMGSSNSIMQKMLKTASGVIVGGAIMIAGLTPAHAIGWQEALGCVGGGLVASKIAGQDSKAGARNSAILGCAAGAGIANHAKNQVPQAPSVSGHEQGVQVVNVDSHRTRHADPVAVQAVNRYERLPMSGYADAFVGQLTGERPATRALTMDESKALQEKLMVFEYKVADFKRIENAYLLGMEITDADGRRIGRGGQDSPAKAVNAAMLQVVGSAYDLARTGNNIALRGADTTSVHGVNIGLLDKFHYSMPEQNIRVKLYGNVLDSHILKGSSNLASAPTRRPGM